MSDKLVMNSTTRVKMVWNAEFQQWERWPVGLSRRAAHWLAYRPAEWVFPLGRLGRRAASWWLNTGPGQLLLQFLYANPHRRDW